MYTIIHFNQWQPLKKQRLDFHRETQYPCLRPPNSNIGKSFLITHLDSMSLEALEEPLFQMLYI